MSHLLQDALLFVGWELIGIICQAFDDDTQLTVDGIQECNRILKVIAEVRGYKIKQKWYLG